MANFKGRDPGICNKRGAGCGMRDGYNKRDSGICDF